MNFPFIFFLYLYYMPQSHCSGIMKSLFWIDWCKGNMKQHLKMLFTRASLQKTEAPTALLQAPCWQSIRRKSIHWNMSGAEQCLLPHIRWILLNLACCINIITFWSSYESDRYRLAGLEHLSLPQRCVFLKRKILKHG